MRNSIAVVIVLTLATFVASSCTPPATKPPPGPPPQKVTPTADPDHKAVEKPATKSRDEVIAEAIEKARKFILTTQQADGTWKDASTTDIGSTTALVTWAVIQGDSQAKHRLYHYPRIRMTLDLLAKFKTNSTRMLALRANLWRLAGNQDHKYRPLMRQDVLPLIRLPRANLVTARYAAMGVVAGRNEGMETPATYWSTTRKYWLAAQNADGGWPAQKDRPSTPEMTAAALNILHWATPSYRSSDPPLGRPAKDLADALTRGEKWLDKNFPKILRNGQDLPHILFEISRAASHTGLARLGGVEWIDAGVAHLLATQKPDGSWDGPLGPETATAYALLFLDAAITPVAFQHFRHGGDWNNWPLGMREMTRWASSKLSARPLAWRVVDVRTPQATMRQAPVLIVTGADAPRFTQQELAVLRTHALAGGFIWTISQGPDFDNSIGDVYHILFPTWPLKPCSRAHRVNLAYFPSRNLPALLAVSNGAITLAVHCPEDLTKAWHRQRSSTKTSAFYAAMNALFYATDRLRFYESPDREDIQWPVPFEGTPKRTVTLARLKYVGNYDPEPLAYVRFKRMMGHETATQVNVVGPVEISKLRTTGAELAVLTGTRAFTLTPAQEQAIKRFVTAGGTLFIDAAGGDIRNSTPSNGFTRSAAMTLASVFPEHMLAELKLDSPIYTVSAKPITRVRWRRTTTLRLLNSHTPTLHAITLDGRPAVIFSDLDITTGLLGAPAADIYGYAPRSAFEIMRNIVLYVAKDHTHGAKAK